MSACPQEPAAPAALPASCSGDDFNQGLRNPALATTTRRQFVKTTLAAAATIALEADMPSIRAATSRDRKGRGLIDTNVTLGRWPFRRLPLDDTSALVAKLRQHGVTQAWAGSFDGLFYQDLSTSNARLAEECRKHGRGSLVPFGSVNPKLPGWEEELYRCAEQHRMPGIRLHPNYHGYELDDAAFTKLLSLASKRKLVVQISMSMEDERMQHRLARVPHVEAKPLLSLLANLSGLRIELLNWFRAMRMELIKQLAAVGVSFDIATLEGVGGVANLIPQVPLELVLFGSHAPWFYFESALLKLKESALNQQTDAAIREGNARRLLAL